MADLKISQLPAAGALSGSEDLPVLQGGTNKRTSLAAALAITHTHVRANITDLGTAAGLNVPASPGGVATASQVVRGDDPRLGAGVPYVNRGNVGGSIVVDMNNFRDTAQRMVLTANTTVSITNVPANAFVMLTLWVVQDATGGRTLTLPGGTVFLYGESGVVNPTANSETLITLSTVNGGTSWLALMSDIRGPDFEPFYFYAPGNGDIEIIFTKPTTLDFAQTVKSGATLAYQKKPSGGSYSAASGSTSFVSGDMLKVTVSGASGPVAFSIVRTA